MFLVQRAFYSRLVFLFISFFKLLFDLWHTRIENTTTRKILTLFLIACRLSVPHFLRPALLLGLVFNRKIKTK